ncbi:unnamed protein product [Pleuronectes platessa]|uniref:Uncharacterized protein n=1 Tax=Pleuronectes platessa TaxID=8262 RepID=A0A9N7VLX0_PLEPL|nr:unnamed protein product [Pleuronectes platessa]
MIQEWARDCQRQSTNGGEWVCIAELRALQYIAVPSPRCVLCSPSATSQRAPDPASCVLDVSRWLRLRSSDGDMALRTKTADLRPANALSCLIASLVMFRGSGVTHTSPERCPSREGGGLPRLCTPDCRRREWEKAAEYCSVGRYCLAGDHISIALLCLHPCHLTSSSLWLF